MDLSLWVEDVVAHLDADEFEDVVLVGHSFCGAVISRVAERAAERLAGLVYLDALVPRNGESAFAAMGPEQERTIVESAEADDGWSVPWFTDDQLDAFYRWTHPDDLRWIRRHVTAQPTGTYREALVLGEPQLRRTYVRCTKTPLPPSIAPGTPGWDWAELNAGHWPMITAPRAISDCWARSLLL